MFGLYRTIQFVSRAFYDSKAVGLYVGPQIALRSLCKHLMVSGERRFTAKEVLYTLVFLRICLQPVNLQKCKA